MAAVPATIADFLKGHRIALAGASQNPRSIAGAIYRKLTASGYEVIPINPKGGEVEGVTCYRDIASAPGSIDGVFAVTPPRAGVDLVRQCADRGIGRIWFHRSFGQGSVSDDAVRECQARGITCIAGACPMMYCAPVDGFHRCFRWWLRVTHKLPA
jgi:uncharacterized protein